MLLQISDTDGKTRALMVHYGVHAIVLGPTNCKFSADYPGALQAKVEAGCNRVSQLASERMSRYYDQMDQRDMIEPPTESQP